MDHNDFLLTQIAKQYYVDKIKQNEIARRYNVTPMMISRYLRKAEQKGIVTIHIKTPWSQDMELGKAVMEKYRLSECIALDIPSGTDEKNVIGKFFADYFSTIVQENMVIGTSWGKTISEFSSALPFLNVSGCSILQLNGAIWMDDLDLMPTRILQQLGQKLNARTYPMNTPLYVDSQGVKDTMMNDPINVAVQELAKHADIAIIGASALDSEATTMTMNPITAGALQELREKGAIGDLAGVFLDKDGNEVEWSKRDLYMGLSLPRIAMAKNTVCLAGNVKKAPILRASARKRYFKTLITTRETAQAMLQFD